MKKVLIVASVTLHINSFHIPYLKLLKENGYEVEVASNGKEKIEYCDKHYNIDFQRSPLDRKNIKAYKDLKKIIDENNYEIIHCHTPTASVLTRLAARGARKKGTRVIYTAHGFHFYKGAPLKNWVVFYPIEKYLSKYTDCSITINEEDYNIAKKKFKAKQIELIHGVGIDETKFNFEMNEEEKNKLRKSLGLEKDDFVIIQVGELNKNKNQIMTIKAMKELVKENNNIKLLLVGEGILENYYKGTIEKYEIKDNVKLLGYRKDIPKLLKISDVLVSTSIREGLPVNVMEAMACGLPIVATDCRGNRDLVKDEENGFIVRTRKKHKKSIRDLVNYIKEIKECENEKKYNNIIFKEHFFKNIKVKMLNIYKNLSGNKSCLIIPVCTDYNRGDQALVMETANIIKKSLGNRKIYIMADDNNSTAQFRQYKLEVVKSVLKHPSRKSTNRNINYTIRVKIKWGIIAVVDFVFSFLLLNKLFRLVFKNFMDKNTKETLEQYEKCSECFVKGGGFIHDYEGGLIGIYKGYYQLYHIMLAQSYGKRVFVMPNSFGPFQSKFVRWMVNKVLNKCQFVSARESISANGKMNGLERDFEIKPDLGFFIEKEKDESINEYLKRNKINPQYNRYIGITVRPYRFPGTAYPKQKYIDYKETIIKIVKYLNKREYKPLFIVQTFSNNEHENDEICVREITAKLNNNEYDIINDRNLNCFQIKAIYGKCKYVIGTRFHSVIFSISQLIPSIAITYGGNKGDGIMHDIGLDNYKLKIEEFEIDRFVEMFENMEKNEEIIKQNIKNYLDIANKEYKKIVEIVKKK